MVVEEPIALQKAVPKMEQLAPAEMMKTRRAQVRLSG